MYIYVLYIQWNLCNPTPEFSDILWHLTKIYAPKVFLLTRIKPEYSDILYNRTHFPGPVVCQIRQIPLYDCCKVLHVLHSCVWRLHDRKPVDLQDDFPPTLLCRVHMSPGLMVIKLSSTSFVLVLQNRPMRSLYLLDMTFDWMFFGYKYEYKLVFKRIYEKNICYMYNWC
jgi:hypothetical protein